MWLLYSEAACQHALLSSPVSRCTGTKRLDSFQPEEPSSSCNIRQEDEHWCQSLANNHECQGGSAAAGFSQLYKCFDQSPHIFQLMQGIQA